MPNFPLVAQKFKISTRLEEAAKFCEGIHIDAPIVSFELIEQQRQLQEQSNDD